MSKGRVNLKGAVALVVDADHFTRGIVARMLRSFGLEPPVLVSSGAEAKDYIQHSYVDFCVVEAVLPDMPGAELISWVRHSPTPVRFIPLIMLTGYTQFQMIAQARDAGASIVVKKPVSPQVLLDHIAWAGKGGRAFIETADYIGPDRRFRALGPPNGKGRREGDPQPSQGEEVNLDEDAPDEKKAAV